MSRRRGLFAGTALLAMMLTGCADVAAGPATTPSSTSSSSAPTTAPSGTPSETPSATPSATPPSTPAVTPSATPSPTPTAKPTKPAKPRPPAAYAKQVEAKLKALGYPVGDVDGDITKRAKQALCAWRETHGMPISRGGLTMADVRSVLRANRKPAAAKEPGIYVNKTCQVLYQVVGKTYKRIVWVSTGAPGYETPSRTGKVWRKWAGAHESSLYDDAYMYDSIYFLKDRPGIALHGSRVNTLIKTYPASHRCVRVMRPQIHHIFTETPIGTKVSVYGKY